MAAAFQVQHQKEPMDHVRLLRWSWQLAFACSLLTMVEPEVLSAMEPCQLRTWLHCRRYLHITGPAAASIAAARSDHGDRAAMQHMNGNRGLARSLYVVSNHFAVDVAAPAGMTDEPKAAKLQLTQLQDQ